MAIRIAYQCSLFHTQRYTADTFGRMTDCNGSGLKLHGYMEPDYCHLWSLLGKVRAE